MSKKILVVVGTTGLIGITVFISISFILFYTVIFRLEEMTVIKNVEQLKYRLDDRLMDLQEFCTDWSSRDDTYDFVINKNREYIDHNLQPVNLMNIPIDFIYFYTVENRYFYGVDTEFNEEIPANAELRNALDNFSFKEKGGKGFLVVRNIPVMLAYHEISDEKKTKPGRGYVVVGLFLGKKEQASLEERNSFVLFLDMLGDSDVSTDVLASRKALLKKNQEIVVMPLSGTTVAGYYLVARIDGLPGFIIRITLHRDLYRLGFWNFLFQTAILFFMIIVIVMIAFFLLNRLIALPIKRLGNYLDSIGNDFELKTLPRDEKHEEIDRLIKSINNMLQNIYETRSRLLEESYYSGIFELAQDVLHNIRNSITPISGKLQLLNRERDTMYDKEMKAARKELMDENTDEQRRRQLVEFIIAGNRVMSQYIEIVMTTINDINAELRSIDTSLEEYNTKAFKNILSQNIDVIEVFRVALEHLRHSLPYAPNFLVNDNIDRSWFIMGHWVIVNRLFKSLLDNILRLGNEDTNYTASINLKEDTRGTFIVVKITAECIDWGNREMETIFKRDYNRVELRYYELKNFHWCANTVAMLGGKMDVKLDEKVKNVVLDISLPVTRGN
ncbi:MAG: hypothetical protein JW969_21055 [Spirochaetales bacterium]|nr:hypothetical protein [Spirochaetales bacterium]